MILLYQISHHPKPDSYDKNKIKSELDQSEIMQQILT